MNARPSPSIAVATALLAVVLVCACARTTRAAEEPSPSAETLVVLGAQTLFGSNRTTLSVAGREALARLLERLGRHGEPLAVRIVGHADAKGPADYNAHLSERRALAVREAFLARWPVVPVITEGAGESEPIASNATAAGRARNRRVEIHVVAREGAGAGRR